MKSNFSATSLGCPRFRADYNIKYAYVAGAMYQGIASKELVVRMGKAGLLGFFGTGGLSLQVIEDSIRWIQSRLSPQDAYGMNLLCNLSSPLVESRTVDLFLKYGIDKVEAAAFVQMTPALVRYRVKGLRLESDGSVSISNKVLAKVSRPETALAFLSPPPERVIAKLLANGEITKQEAELSVRISMADDLCAEASSGGHTDQADASTLIPTLVKLRDEHWAQGGSTVRPRVGAAGGIGTPEAAAAAFVLGADFILTGSINQCTVEAGTSDTVKNLLQQANIQDTELAPAADMFELGARVQVLKKGVFFPARANKLYNLYRHHNSLDEIDQKTRERLEKRYFHRTFAEVYDECRSYFQRTNPDELTKAERSPKHKMALVFRWYLGHGTKFALEGNDERRVDFQIQCGPALGAFNQWVQGTNFEPWQNRHVDEIGERLMNATASILSRRYDELHARAS